MDGHVFFIQSIDRSQHDSWLNPYCFSGAWEDLHY